MSNIWNIDLRSSLISLFSKSCRCYFLRYWKVSSFKGFSRCDKIEDFPCEETEEKDTSRSLKSAQSREEKEIRSIIKDAKRVPPRLIQQRSRLSHFDQTSRARLSRASSRNPVSEANVKYR